MQFLEMGGYGAFVWSAWAVALGVLAGLLAVSLIARARIRRELERRGLDQRQRRGPA